jgi:hypothetical protein
VLLGTPAFANAGGGAALNASSTAMDLAYPSPAAAAGDLLVIHASTDNDSVLSVPAGWTAFGAQVNVTTVFGARMWYKIATGTESGTVTVERVAGGANITFCALMYRFTNPKQSGTPFEGYLTNTGTSTTPTGNNAVASGIRRRAVTLCAYSINDADGSTPSGVWQEAIDGNASTGNGVGFTLDTAAAASETITALTRTVSASTPWVAFTFCLIPNGA